MDIYKKAFKLVGFQADNPIELLKQLSDVACHLLDLNGATDNVYYFSLPIWDYAKSEWMKEVCSCVNKKKDKEFESGSGWYKSYQDYPHTTTYARFFKDAKQNGFSFIEFMTQEVKEFIPVFTIHMEPSDAVEPTFSLEADSEELGRKLQLIGNKTDSFENEGNVNRFMETTAKLLTNNGVDSLEDKQRNDLKLLYEFLCKYQQYFGDSLTIYLISSKIFSRSDGSSIGSGGMVLVCKKAVTEEVLMQLSIVINLCYRELGGKNWEERWRKVVVGASIAQVMARNLSHNYGSHVLNHLLHPIWGTFRLDNTSSPYKCNYSGPEQDAEINETFQQIISLIKTFFGKFNDADFSRINVANYEWLRQSIDKAKEDLQNAVDNVERVTKTPVLDLNKLSNESLRQIVYLLNHIKCRVDYISDISFGVPMLETTRLVHSDIFRELDRVGLLMNHISGLEDQFQYKIILTGPRGSSLDRTEEAEAMDLKVAVPNDVVGTHAFYNILENIIRNTAKHGNTKEEVTFYINFSNISEQDLDNDAALINESKQYYCVEIHDNVCMEKTAAKILVKAQNERLNEPVFENERPRSHSLGLVEMEASAAYLRKLDSSAVDDDLFVVEVNNDKLFNHHKQFNLLKAFVKKDETGCHLGYRFFMLRPREVLMIDGPEK